MVTVGIINYNLGRYLPRAIDSALSQGAEVIVVDDCSTDDSVEVALNHDVLLVAHDTNSGSAIKGWNDVLSLATGEWVIFLSADDMLAPGAVEQIEATHDADWVYGDLLLIDEDDRPLDEWVYMGWPTDPITALARGLKTLSIPVTMFAAFRTDWLRENDCVATDFDGMHMAGDTATCIRWLKRWPRIKRLPLNLFWYRQHSAQETHALNDRRGELHAAILDLYDHLFDARTLSVLRSL